MVSLDDIIHSRTSGLFTGWGRNSPALALDGLFFWM